MTKSSSLGTSKFPFSSLTLSIVVCRAGLSRGFAFVYLQKASDVANVIDYVDGRHLNGRQVRAKASLVGSLEGDSKKPSFLK